MKFLRLYTSHYRPCVKVAALVVFIATPGSVLALPLVAWWMARKTHGLEPSSVRN